MDQPVSSRPQFFGYGVVAALKSDAQVIGLRARQVLVTDLAQRTAVP